MKILVIDNNDSFTYNLVDLLKQVVEKVEVINESDFNVKLLQDQEYSAVLLSPGPGKPTDYNYQYELFKQNLPIFGVCLGMQMIGEYFNMNLANAPQPVHGYTSDISLKKSDIFKNIPNKIRVMRYHSLVLTNPNEKIEILAESCEGLAMALKVVDKPFYGVQFHPESILTEFGYEMLENWTKKLSL